MNPTEIERLARMAASIKPDWVVKSLITALTNFIQTHPHRSYGDTAHALLEIALDPATKNPGRLAEDGPWWKARPGVEKERVITSGPTCTVCPRCRRPLIAGEETDNPHHCRGEVGTHERTQAVIDALNQARQQLATQQGATERALGERVRLQHEAREKVA